MNIARVATKQVSGRPPVPGLQAQADDLSAALAVVGAHQAYTDGDVALAFGTLARSWALLVGLQGSAVDVTNEAALERWCVEAEALPPNPQLALLAVAAKSLHRRRRGDEQLAAAAAAIARQNELGKLVASVSSSLTASQAADVDDAIHHALAQIGAFVGADRSYVFAYSADGRTTSNTHEWCADGIEPQIAYLQGVDVESLGPLIALLRDGEVIRIADVNALGGDDTNAREILQMQGILSLILVPVSADGGWGGFVGFDAVRSHRHFDEESGELLKAAGSVVFHALVRARAQRSLVERERFLRTITEHLSEVVFLRELTTGDLLYINPAFEVLSGLTIAEVRAEPEAWFELVHPDDREVLRRDHLLRLSDGGSFDYRIVKPGGVVRWISSRMVPVLDVQPPLLVGLVEDVTERKALEQALLEQNAHLEARVAERTAALQQTNTELVAAGERRDQAMEELRLSEFRFRSLIPATVLILRAGNVVYASPAAERAIGESASELLGHPVSRWISVFGHHLDSLFADVAASRPGEVRRETLELRGVAGSPRTLDASLVRIDDAPVPTMLLMGVDVTDRRTAEATARDALDRIGGNFREEAMVEMSAALAHELNQPLTAVTYFLEAAVAGLSTPNPRTDWVQGMRRAQEQAQRAGDIVHRLRALFGRRLPARVEMRALDLFGRVLDLFQEEAQRNQICLAIEDKQEDVTLWADARQAELLLANLLRNAVFACSDAPLPRLIRVGARSDADGVEVWVRDTAPPIDPAIRERLFSSFLTIRSGGMGMGLYLSQRIVEGHGGRLRLVEHEGGKSFVSFFPHRSQR